VPAALEGMRDLTVTLGGVACEQRMIGWRIGWMVASAAVTPQLGMVHIYNGLVASGFDQLGAIAALRADDHAAGVAEWERRHDATMEQLAGLPAIPAYGGWSLLLDAEAAGTTAPDLPAALLEHKVAATPMTAWGETVAPRHVRFVLLQRARREARSARRARARRAQLIHARDRRAATPSAVVALTPPPSCECPPARDMSPSRSPSVERRQRRAGCSYPCNPAVRRFHGRSARKQVPYATPLPLSGRMRASGTAPRGLSLRTTGSRDGRRRPLSRNHCQKRA
jgi:hypothetical protein